LILGWQGRRGIKGKKNKEERRKEEEK